VTGVQTCALPILIRRALEWLGAMLCGMMCCLSITPGVTVIWCALRWPF